MQNGVTIINPIRSDKVTTEDILFAMLKDLGCGVSSMPDNARDSSALCSRWEYFNPEKVEDPATLPEHWAKVWKLHTATDRRACVEFRYRYVHCPQKILPRYPRIPCRGIFCLDDRRVRWNAITGDDLIWIGNEIENVWTDGTIND